MAPRRVHRRHRDIVERRCGAARFSAWVGEPCFSALILTTAALTSSLRAPFQSGEFLVPVKYGHVSAGVVEAGPHDLRGRTVFCLYLHQTRCRVRSAVASEGRSGYAGEPAGHTPARKKDPDDRTDRKLPVRQRAIPPDGRAGGDETLLVPRLPAHLVERHRERHLPDLVHRGLRKPRRVRARRGQWPSSTSPLLLAMRLPSVRRLHRKTSVGRRACRHPAKPVVGQTHREHLECQCSGVGLPRPGPRAHRTPTLTTSCAASARRPPHTGEVTIE